MSDHTETPGVRRSPPQEERMGTVYTVNGQHHYHPGSTGYEMARIITEQATRLAAVEALADDPEVIERAAREAFWTDDMGGHHKPGSRPHTWENIPEVGRENYRTLVRAVLQAALTPEATP